MRTSASQANDIDGMAGCCGEGAEEADEGMLLLRCVLLLLFFFCFPPLTHCGSHVHAHSLSVSFLPLFSRALLVRLYVCVFSIEHQLATLWTTAVIAAVVVAPGSLTIKYCRARPACRRLRCLCNSTTPTPPTAPMTTMASTITSSTTTTTSIATRTAQQ